MAMEAEVPILFITCFSIVFALKIAAGTALIRRQNGRVRLWAGHLLCELAAFWSLFSAIFAGRLPFFPGSAPAMASEDASLALGLFGVFWAFAVFFLLAVLAGRGKK